jgi:hypothetical protein
MNHKSIFLGAFLVLAACGGASPPAAAPTPELTSARAEPASRSASPANAAPAQSAGEQGIEQWDKHFPEAARDLGVWVKNHPEAAKLFFEWDGQHTQQAYVFVAWTVGHPQSNIDGFVREHRGWEHFDTIAGEAPPRGRGVHGVVATSRQGSRGSHGSPWGARVGRRAPVRRRLAHGASTPLNVPPTARRARGKRLKPSCGLRPRGLPCRRCLEAPRQQLDEEIPHDTHAGDAHQVARHRRRPCWRRRRGSTRGRGSGRGRPTADRGCTAHFGSAARCRAPKRVCALGPPRARDVLTARVDADLKGSESPGRDLDVQDAHRSGERRHPSQHEEHVQVVPRDRGGHACKLAGMAAKCRLLPAQAPGHSHGVDAR